jgi:hypothetical protein
MITNFIRNGAVRPNRYEDERNEKYHIDMARYCVDNGLCKERDEFIRAANTNLEFFRNNQWIEREDIDNFLKDDSGNLKNRIKAVKNKLIPIIAQYLGNARKMRIDYSVHNISEGAVNRREEKLAELMAITQLALNSDEDFANYIRANMPIGEDLQATEELFENIYVDDFTESVKQFNRIMSKELRLDDYKESLAFSLAISGLCGLRYDFYNGDYVVDQVDWETYFYDHTAKKLDLSDAMFMGDVTPVAPEYVIEKHNLKGDQKKALLDRDSYDPADNGKVPYARAYWIDVEAREFGWVLDPFGYNYLVELNKEDQGKTYTEKDLVPESQLTPKEKEVLNGNKGRIEIDVIRYCFFVPSEALSTSVGTKDDLVLEWGILEYQDTEAESISNIKFPYKMRTWYLIKGKIFTPISALINPQRLINRMASVQENLINTALPSNMMYDPAMVEDEAEFVTNVYEGKPNRVDTKGLGIGNLVQHVRGGFDGSVQLLDQLMESQSISMDRMIGVNESLRGENQGANKLVGVTALEIQRASLAQESFYGALSDVFESVHESIVNVARRVYADAGRKLAIMVGDKNAQVLTLSAEYNAEDFRVYVRRIADPEQTELVNQEKLLALFDRQIIGKPILAKYWDAPEKISEAIKDQVILDMELQKAQQEAMAQQQAQEQEEQMIQEAREDGYKQVETQEKDMDRQMKMIETLANNQKEKQENK